MKAVVLNQAGGTENYTLRTLDQPEPGPRHVVVRVRACGVAHRDLIERRGGHPAMRFPIVQGHEFSGEIVAVGDQVKAWKVGDRVINLYKDSCGHCTDCLGGDERYCTNQTEHYGLTANGGYAEYACVHERAMELLHDDISFETAATLMSALGVGYNNVVHRARVQPGENVVITGATGGVGIGAVQAANLAGATVWAVTSSDAKADKLRELGAAVVLVDDGKGFHKKIRAQVPSGVDAVIECVGEPTFNSSLRVLRRGGRLVDIGNIGIAPYQLNLGFLVLNNLTVMGSDNVTRRALRELMTLVANGRIKPVIDRILPLEQVAEAHRMVENREVFGRIVLRP
jgi:D-arabinose 1-dehydrogenase-like Zn-dependent alcohol dehydrogenase